MKYYAVKKGRDGSKPAIYLTWNDCKEQVQGVSGAIYKSFTKLEEAKEYIKENNLDKSLTREDILYAYVDGSYNQKLNIAGFGLALVINDKVVYEHKEKLDDKDYVQYRNVYGEVKGTEEAVKKAIELGYKEVGIVYDYTGIENWALGNWKANNPLTKEYSKVMKDYSSQININFIKVKAHAKESDGGHKYNDLVDRLAKESVGI